MDAVNCISKAELFVGLTQVKVRIKAFKHIVGQPTENAMLAGQIQPELPREHPNNNAIQTRSRATCWWFLTPPSCSEHFLIR